MIRIRVTGRTLRPGCIATRRLFIGTLGVETIRVPRSENPYALARRIRRYLQNDDVAFLRRLAAPRKTPAVPPMGPDVDSPEPVDGLDHVAAAE